ncbi:MAG: hypothetical protein KAY65_10135 [Planctomycetes bacterium]|nr:hypothetical protein [Planctomycetota bacterium]
MLIVGPDGENIEYVDTSYQTAVRHEVILPGETITLADEYDVTSQYGIAKPGRYTFQFKGGSGWNIKRSNTVKVKVKPGKLPAADSIYSKILSVLPQGWTATRRLLPIDPLFPEIVHRPILVHLVGKRSGKQIYSGITVVIAEDGSSLMPGLLNELRPWGKCRWGDVYVGVRNAELLWPDYREQIVKALDIEEIGAD